jgi:cysteinyl-tRNA synthetase
VEFDIPKEILEIAEKRFQAKQNKDWNTADKLRDELSSKGYKVVDSKDSYQVVEA